MPPVGVHITVGDNATPSDILRSIFNKLTFFGGETDVVCSFESAEIKTAVSNIIDYSFENKPRVKLIELSRNKEDLIELSQKSSAIFQGDYRLELIKRHYLKFEILWRHISQNCDSAAEVPVLYAYDYGNLHSESFGLRRVEPALLNSKNAIDSSSGKFIFSKAIGVVPPNVVSDSDYEKLFLATPFLVDTRYMHKTMAGSTVNLSHLSQFI